MIYDDYSSLVVNVEMPSFAISNDFKQLIVMNTTGFFTTG